MPAALFVMHEIPRILNPKALPTIASGTVDIPTAETPSVLYACISAGVSKAGPDSAK